MTAQRFRILFDGIMISETPIGWEDITSKITRDKDLNALFITTEAQLTFRDDGYDYLIDLYSNSFCSSVDVDLQEWCGGYYVSFSKGIIFLSRSEIDRKECTITVPIEDNSFYAKIKNNRGIEVFPFAEQSKNGSTIDVCPITKMFFFDPNTGAYNGIVVAAPYTYTCAGYLVYDLFNYLITFMTDSEVEFDSELFGSNGAFAGLFVTCGIVVRQAIGTTGTTEEGFKENFQKLSFKQLYEEIHKKVNIGMYVDYSGVLPKIKIEREQDIRTSGTSFQALTIDGLLEKVDSNRIFSTIRLGSSITNDAPYVLFPEDISFRGFKEEQFFTDIRCNIERELNLVSGFVVSANVIEAAYVHGRDDYDEDTFLIMGAITGVGFVEANQDNIDLDGTGTPPVFYNMELTNQASINNFLGGIPGSIAQYLGNPDNSFSAINTSSTTFPAGPIQTIIPTYLLFPTDVLDPSNLWNGTRYTVPSSGLYTFEVDLYFSVTPPTGGVIYLERRDSGGVTIVSTVEIYFMGLRTNEIVHILASASIVAVAGDFIYLRFDTFIFNPFSNSVLSDSTFACTNTETGGGIYKTFDPNDYPVRQHEWEFPLTLDDYKDIVTNQTDQIEFSRYMEKHYSGWIDSVSFKRFSTEMAKFVTYRAKLLPKPTNEPIEFRQVTITGALEDIPVTFNQPDYYGDPFGSLGTTDKMFFYTVGRLVTVSIPATYLGLDAGYTGGLVISLQRITATGSTYELIYLPLLTVTFIIETGTNYELIFQYDVDTVGDTWPHTYVQITAPATAGLNGTALIVAFAPDVIGDFTFLWSTGAVTPSITEPTGDYWCQVTYVPGTYDNNIITHNVRIPISATGG